MISYRNRGYFLFNLIFMLFFMFLFINIASAEIINGNFETGTIAGWHYGGIGPIRGVSAQTYAESSGTYGADCYITSSGALNHLYLGPNPAVPDWTGQNYLFFDMRILETNHTSYLKIMKPYNGDILYSNYNLNVGPYKTYEIDLTGYEYTGEGVFYFSLHTQYETARIYLDNIRFSDNPSPCSINFYPDIDIADTDPSEIYYSVNSTWDPWNIFIVGSWSISIDGQTIEKSNIEYGMLEGPVNPVAGYHDVWGTDYNITDYEICLKAWYWDPELEQSVFIDLACDNQTVIYDAVEPPPIPTYTPIPTPTSTSLPTPTPDPGENDTKINSSFMDNYYGSVDNIYNSLNDSFINSSGFLLSPVVDFTSLVNEVNTTFSNTTNETLVSRSILLSIMVPMITNIPSKVLAVGTYYLLLCLILIILKEP